MITSFATFYIAQISEKDAWRVCNLMVANEDRFKTYLPKTLAENSTPTLAKLFCSKKQKQFETKEEFLFTINEKETDTLVGLVYIKELDWTKKQGEFAYCIDYNFEGKGITSQAIESIIPFAFEELQLETLQIIVHETNIASTKVALNNSFKWIKTLKEEYTPPNQKPLDMELYELHKN